MYFTDIVWVTFTFDAANRMKAHCFCLFFWSYIFLLSKICGYEIRKFLISRTGKINNFKQFFLNVNVYIFQDSGFSCIIVLFRRFGLVIKLSFIMGVFFLFEVVSSFYDFKKNVVTEHVEIIWDFINCLQGTTSLYL